MRYDVVGLGALNVDQIVAGASQAEDAERVLPRKRLDDLANSGSEPATAFLGGSAFNVLWLLGKTTEPGEPYNYALIGAAGDTREFGLREGHAAALSSVHVESLFSTHAEEPGMCVSLTSPTGRQLFVNPGANTRIVEQLSDPEQRETLLEALRGCRVLHVTSLLENPYSPDDVIAKAVVDLITDARDLNSSLLVSLDPGDPWVMARNRPPVRALFSEADLLFLNQQEFTGLTGSLPVDVEAIRSLHELCPRAAVHILKRHTEVHVVHPSGLTVSTIERPPTDAQAVDPTGAGDAFAAGVLAAIVRNRSIVDGARFGLSLASARVSAGGDTGHARQESAQKFWTGQTPNKPDDTDRFARFVSRAEGVNTIAKAIGAVAALLVAFVIGASGIVQDLFSGDPPQTQRYLAVPGVTAYQYAFPHEGAQSSAHPILVFGNQIDVICRVDAPDQGEGYWLQLDRGTYVRGSQAEPAPGADPPPDLPAC